MPMKVTRYAEFDVIQNDVEFKVIMTAHAYPDEYREVVIALAAMRLAQALPDVEIVKAKLTGEVDNV